MQNYEFLNDSLISIYRSVNECIKEIYCVEFYFLILWIVVKIKFYHLKTPLYLLVKTFR